jgi:hypothetical protein
MASVKSLQVNTQCYSVFNAVEKARREVRAKSGEMDTEELNEQLRKWRAEVAERISVPPQSGVLKKPEDG